MAKNLRRGKVWPLRDAARDVVVRRPQLSDIDREAKLPEWLEIFDEFPLSPIGKVSKRTW
jgi:non-ribosomal peptide synthetase component E (peptide arylation enzyme)